MVGAGLGILAPVMGMLTNSPTQVKANDIAEEVMSTILDGHRDMPGTGLRYASSIIMVTQSTILYYVGGPDIAQKRPICIQMWNSTPWRYVYPLGKTDGWGTGFTLREAFPSYIFPNGMSNSVMVTDNVFGGAIPDTYYWNVFSYYDETGALMDPNEATLHPDTIGRVDVEIQVRIGNISTQIYNGKVILKGSANIKQH
jgi:hypothetical protein